MSALGEEVSVSHSSLLRRKVRHPRVHAGTRTQPPGGGFPVPAGPLVAGWEAVGRGSHDYKVT